MHGLTQDGVANLGTQSARRYEIHRSSQQVLKVALHFEEPEQPHRTGEVDEQIDVAVDSGLPLAVEPKRARDPTPSRASSARCPASFVNTASRSFMVSLVALYSLAVKPGTVGRIAEEAQPGWQRIGSVFHTQPSGN